MPGQLADSCDSPILSSVFFDNQVTDDEKARDASTARVQAHNAAASLRRHDPGDADQFLQAELDRAVASDDGLDCAAVVSCVSPIPDDVIVPKKWSRVVVGAWKGHDKIHNLENRAALFGLKTAAAEPRCRDSEVCSFGDNLAEVLASESGRARCMNSTLAAVAPLPHSFLLASGGDGAISKVTATCRMKTVV